MTVDGALWSVLIAYLRKHSFLAQGAQCSQLHTWQAMNDRAYCTVQVPSMTVGGALWFTDLTVADPYYLLPIAASGVFLLTVELGAADGMQVQFLT